MRFVVRLIVAPIIVLSLGLLSVSVFNIAAAGAMYAIDGATFASTCEMTRAFGARFPTCSVRTGLPAFDAEAGAILSGHEPFRVWGAVGAASAAVLWSCFAVLGLVTAARSEPSRHRAPRFTSRPSAEDDARLGFAPGAL